MQKKISKQTHIYKKAQKTQHRYLNKNYYTNQRIIFTQMDTKKKVTFNNERLKET